MTTTATIRKDEGDLVREFKLKLNYGRHSNADLFALWDRMTPDQREMCIEEMRALSDELECLLGELVERNTRRISFLECVFLGTLVLFPICYKVLIDCGWAEPIGQDV